MSNGSVLAFNPVPKQANAASSCGDDEISVCTLSECRDSAGTAMRLTSRDSRQFIFIYSGSGSVELDGNTVEVRPGFSLSVPSGAICILRIGATGDGICLKIRDHYFRSQIVSMLPILAQHGAPYWQLYHTPQLFDDLAGDCKRDRRDTLMREMLAARRRIGLGCDPAVASYMLIILFEPHLIASQRHLDPDGAHHVRTSARGVVLEFKNLVEQNFTRHLQVHDYCDLLKVTPRRLSYLCTLVMGMKPLALIHERVILQAKRELMVSGKPVGTIAGELGFADVGYFSRFVKQHTGMSPVEFRR
jgi:AraC family transcriptional activator of pobA